METNDPTPQQPNEETTDAAGSPARAAPQGGYDIVGPPAERPEPARPEPPAAPAATGLDEVSAAAGSTFQPAGPAASDPVVRRVWGRRREWAWPMLWMVASIAFVVLLRYSVLSASLLVLAIGIGAGAYQIAITLERPVRVTAQHAAQEFYGALNHRFPNYRRAYGLLTAGGQRSERFMDLAGFRAYWNAVRGGFSRAPAWLRPPELRVEKFECHYDAGKTTAEIEYVLRVVWPRKAATSEPLAQIPMRNLAVRGPDGMWYLNSGSLPGQWEPLAP